MDAAPTNFTPTAKLRPVKTENKLFDESVQLLSLDHIKENLTKILKFLKSEGRELVFRDVTDKTKVFLEHLLKDHNNFKYKSFHSSVLAIGNEILSVLESNKSNYKLVVTDESGRSVKNALVYRKQFFSGMKQTTVGMKRSRVLSPKSGALNATIPSQIDESKISSTFKINLLNSTIKFLKDTSQTEFVYAEMSITESKLVQDLILQDHEDDVGFGFKSIYAGLWQVLKEFKANGYLQMNVEKCSNDTVILTLKKVQKHGTQPKKTVDTKLTVSINNDVKPNTTVNQDKQPKVTNKIQSSITTNKDIKPNIPLNKIIQIKTPTKKEEEKSPAKISGQFLKRMLQTILDFVNDDLRSSLVIGELTLDEATVVVQLCSMAKKSKPFIKECMELAYKLRDGLKCLRNRHLLLNTSIGKEVKTKNGVPATRSALFNKTPALPSTSKMAVDNNTRTQKPANMSHRNLSLNRPNQKQRLTVDKVRSKSIIQFESAGSLDPKDMSIDEIDGGIDKIERGRSRTRDVPKRTAKLMEDLSVPLESERGMRMMLLMGWKGGALGLHEQGIKEPIMPTLDLAKGAGLGHVKKIPRTIEEFRKDFLQHVINFTNSEYLKYVIDYLNEPLRNPEITCLFDVIDAINRRCMVVCEDDVFRAMLDSFIITISNSTDGFDCSVHPDMSKVFLQKKRNITYSNTTNNFIQIYCTGQTMPLPDDSEYITKEVLLNTSRKTRLNEILNKNNPNEKIRNTAIFRTTFLSKLLEFTKGNCKIKQLVYRDRLTEKYQCYFVRIIDCLNRNKKPDMANLVEYGFVNDLLISKRDFDIKLHIGSSLLNIILEKRPLLHKTTKNIQRCIVQRNPNLINTNTTNDTIQNKVSNERNKTQPGIIKATTEKNNTLTITIDLTKERVDTQSKSVELTSQQNNIDPKKVSNQQSNTQDKTVKVTNAINKSQPQKVKPTIEQNNLQPRKVKLTTQHTNTQDKTAKTTYVNNNNVATTVNPTSKQNAVKPASSNNIQVKTNGLNTDTINEDDDVILLEKEIPVVVISDSEDDLDDVNHNNNVANNVNNKTDNNGTNCSDKGNSMDLDLNENIDTVSNKDSSKIVSKGTECGNKVSSTEVIANGTNKASNNDNLKSVDNTTHMESEVTNNNETRSKPEAIKEKAVESVETAFKNPSNTDSDKDIKETDANNNTKELNCINEEVNTDKMNVTCTEMDLSAIEMIEDDLLDDNSYDVYNESNNLDINDAITSKNKENDMNLEENATLSNELDEREMEDSSSSKRFRDGTDKDSNSKKAKPNKFDNYKNIIIVPENYPQETIDYVEAEEIQGLISKYFDSSEAVLPRLKCLGIQDGGLVYCCHTEITYFWLENLISVTKKFKFIDFNNKINKSRYKVALKMRSFIRENCDVIFKRIKIYNKSLLTEQWVVLEETRIKDVFIIKIDIDCDSYEYICKENFKLYAGIDQAQFSLIFD